MMIHTARLTDGARHVLAFAKQIDGCSKWNQASALGILLGLINEHGAAAHFLEKAGLDQNQIRRAIQELRAKHPERGTAQLVVESANNEASRLGKPYVGTEHLLLGVTLLEGNVASPLLKNVGFDHQRAIAEIEAELKKVIKSRPSTSHRIGTRLRALFKWLFWKRKKGADDC